MRCLSHGTRAYIINADGLPGFVIKFEIMRALRIADESGQLEHARKFQVIDLNAIESKLASFTSRKRIKVEGKMVM